MKHLLLVFIFLLPIEAIAQYDFGAIADIEQKKLENDETKRLAAIAKAAERAKIAKQKADQRAKLAKQKEDKRAKLAKQKQDAANKAQQVILADKKADKNREQSYEDELRALNLQVMRAKADRTNDFIDADLSKTKMAEQKENERIRVAQQKHEAKQADKVREQAYEDEVRALNLQVMKAKANRANDYIDADLSEAKASTDGIQADADRVRMKGKAEMIRAENPADITVNTRIKIIE